MWKRPPFTHESSVENKGAFSDNNECYTENTKNSERENLTQVAFEKVTVKIRAS